MTHGSAGLATAPAYNSSNDVSYDGDCQQYN